jgi:quinol-cytochrome oxidoreductase complex cytochrome b subunit
MAQESETRVARLKAWFLERSGFATLNAFGLKQLGKPVPTRLSWLYTTGALALFYFGLQILTGCLLLTVYVPHEDLAYRSVQVIEHQATLGWLVRQCHSWGASFIVIVLCLHMFKVLWFGTYKRPREFTWFVGCLLFAITLGFCFSGYLLPWNQLAFWATRVGIAAVDSVPLVGPQIKEFICGGAEVSGSTIGRFFSLHVVVLPGILLAMLSWHLALITWKGISPKTSVTEELELGNVAAMRRKGSEPFFPRQVYRDLIACTIGFALLVTAATFWPWHLGEPADQFSTPEGIKPEWYFLPVYQFLKYFDDNLYSALPFLDSWGVQPDFLGVMTINFIAGILFLLPVLDRGKERKITRRPLFALLAFVFLVGVVGMGILGYVSEKTIVIGGTKYHFDTKGLLTDPPAEEEGESESQSESESDSDSDSEPDSDSDSEPDSDSDSDSEPDSESESDTDTDGGADSVSNADSSPPASIVTFRSDGLPPGGACVGCHEDQKAEWTGSVHHAEQIECALCHGGNDTAAPEKLLGILEDSLESEDTNWPEDLDDDIDTKRSYLWAHRGIQLNRKGEPSTPRSKEVPSFCGKCHEPEREHWTAAQPAHKKSCVRCHGNHEVKRTGPFLYDEDGYTDENDDQTIPFREIRKILLAVDERFEAVDKTLETLKDLGYPLDGAVEEQQRFDSLVSKKRSLLKPLVHTLNQKRVQGEADELVAAVDELHETMLARLENRDDRWFFVVGVWLFALLFASLFALKLRSFGKPSASEGAATEDESAASVSTLDTERGALLHPLDPADSAPSDSDPG